MIKNLNIRTIIQSSEDVVITKKLLFVQDENVTGIHKWQIEKSFPADARIRRKYEKSFARSDWRQIQNRADTYKGYIL